MIDVEGCLLLFSLTDAVIVYNLNVLQPLSCFAPKYQRPDLSSVFL